MSLALKPILAIDEIYGPRHAYAPRAHPKTSRWINLDPALLDAFTANQICVARDMPVVCSKAVVSPEGFDLLREGGLTPTSAVHPFHSETNAFETVQGLARQGIKLVIQHIYPDGIIPDEAMWVSRSLLTYLNNKANMADLVPAAQVPMRKCRSAASVFSNGSVKLPIVIKVATNESTGGGTAVAVCRTPADLAAAADRFSDCPTLVLEQFLPLVNSPCVNYAVMPDGSVRYLGYADQDLTEEGKYRGNWLDSHSPLSSEQIKVGMQIAQRGADLGFRGVLGMDMAQLADGTFFVIDLNFRFNGSTTAILLAPAIQAAFGTPVLHMRGFAADDFDRMLAVARAAVRRRRIVPIATFNPIGHPGAKARMNALVLGDSKADVQAVERELGEEGLA